MKTFVFLSDFWKEWKDYINTIFYEKDEIPYECYPIPRSILVKNDYLLPPFFLTYEIKGRKGDNSSLFCSHERISGLISWTLEVNFFSPFPSEDLDIKGPYEKQEDILFLFEGFIRNYYLSKKNDIQITSFPESTYALEQDENGSIFTCVKKIISIELTKTLIIGELN